MTTLEHREFELHRAFAALRIKMDGLKARLAWLEADPIPTTQQREEALAQGRQQKVDEFWELVQAEQSTYHLSGAEARQRVLRKRPDLRTIYPVVRD